jgi:hypothetical protein
MAWAPMFMVVPPGTKTGFIIERDTGYMIYGSRWDAEGQAFYAEPGSLVAQVDPINRDGGLAFVACQVQAPRGQEHHGSASANQERADD